MRVSIYVVGLLGGLLLVNGESSRTTKACDANKGISKTKVEQATPTRAYYAIAKGCVDLYPAGGKHSVWQDCQESEKVGFNRN